jgi:hypothetical protein
MRFQLHGFLEMDQGSVEISLLLECSAKVVVRFNEIWLDC